MMETRTNNITFFTFIILPPYLFSNHINIQSTTWPVLRRTQEKRVDPKFPLLTLSDVRDSQPLGPSAEAP